MGYWTLTSSGLQTEACKPWLLMNNPQITSVWVSVVYPHHTPVPFLCSIGYPCLTCLCYPEGSRACPQHACLTFGQCRHTGGSTWHHLEVVQEHSAHPVALGSGLKWLGLGMFFSLGVWCRVQFRGHLICKPWSVLSLSVPIPIKEHNSVWMERLNFLEVQFVTECIAVIWEIVLDTGHHYELIFKLMYFSS